MAISPYKIGTTMGCREVNVYDDVYLMYIATARLTCGIIRIHECKYQYELSKFITESKALYKS